MTMGEIGCFLSHYSIWQEVSFFPPSLLFRYFATDIFIDVSAVTPIDADYVS